MLGTRKINRVIRRSQRWICPGIEIPEEFREEWRGKWPLEVETTKITSLSPPLSANEIGIRITYGEIEDKKIIDLYKAAASFTGLEIPREILEAQDKMDIKVKNDISYWEATFE